MKGKVLFIVCTILILIAAVSAQSNPADIDRDGCVDIGEINTYISLWLQGQVSLTDVNGAVIIWLQGCGVADTCEKVFGNSNVYGTMNIFFVGVNYDEDQILTNDLDFNNWDKNLQNDMNRFLFSPDEYIGYGLLTVEPFSSKLDKINVYLVTTPHTCEPCGGNDALAIKQLVMNSCSSEYHENSDKIVPIIGSDKMDNYIITQASVYRKSFWDSIVFSDVRDAYQSSVTTFVHEFGHDLGLLDNYGANYRRSFVQPFYDSGPNCDPTPGCPKWCEGTVAVQYYNQPFDKARVCDNHTTLDTCNADILYECIWLEDYNGNTFKDPYFNSSCVPISVPDLLFDNIGSNCVGDDGCYWGCGPHGGGFRPRPRQQLTDERVDASGKKHHYSLVAERYVQDIFDCCFNSDTNNYDFAKCDEFSKTPSLRQHLYAQCNQP